MNLWGVGRVCHVNTGATRGQKEEVTTPQELELQAIVSYLTWVWGSELPSSLRAANILNTKDKRQMNSSASTSRRRLLRTPLSTYHAKTVNSGFREMAQW